MERIKLRQRVLVNVDKRDLSTTIVGQKSSLPIALAPVGLCGMQHGNGEILAGAGRERSRHSVLSCRRCPICSIEQVAEDDEEAVLVSGLCDPRPRFHRGPDLARQGGELLGARS